MQPNYYRLLIGACMLLFVFSTFGQTETEPNNTQATANSIAEGTSVLGNVGPGDIDDYFIGTPSDDGTLTMTVHYTNTSADPNADISIYMYNEGGAQIASQFFSNVGFPASDTIDLTEYCRLARPHYFRVSASLGFDYSVSFNTVSSGVADAEPNDARQQAIFINEGDTAQGRVGYATSGFTDNQDYYGTVLPDDGAVRLNFRYKSTSGNSSADFAAYIYDKAGNQLEVVSLSNQQADTMLSSSIIEYCREADTVYFRFAGGQGCFSYDFDYEVISSGQKDAEPNDALGQATFISHGDTTQGRVGHASFGYTDGNDYYGTVLPDDGAVRLNFRYKSTSGNSSADFTAYIYDKAGNQLEVVSLSNQQADTMLSSSIIEYCREADTVYFRFAGGQGCFSYDFDYEVIPSGQKDAEPNDVRQQAIFINEGDTALGRVAHGSSGYLDGTDYYSTLLQGDGAVQLNIRFKNTSGGSGADITAFIFNKDGLSLGGASMFNQPNDTIISTSFTAYCVQADTVYFRIQGGQGCFSYDLDYELIASGAKDAEPNNSLATANIIDLTTTSEGTVGHGNVAFDGTDYFKFYNSGYSEIKWSFDYNNTSNGSSADYSIALLNSGGAVLQSQTASNRPIGPGSDSITFSCLPLDTFYLKIDGGQGCFGYTNSFDLVSGTFYADADGDNFGDPDSSIYSCAGPPPGFIADNNDCNDADSTINPNAVEVCDGVDNNCDGNIDEGIFTTSNINDSICEGDSVLIGGLYRFTSGVYIDTTIIMAGCDSISVVTLTVNPTDTTGSTTTTTEPGMAGIFPNTFQNRFGCDSTHIDTVLFVPLPGMDTLRITEIMYNPPEGGTDSLEYIEIYNAGLNAVNLDGYSIDNAIIYTFGNVNLPAGAYVVVCTDSSALFSQFGVSGYMWSGILNNTAETILLKDNLGRTLDSVEYDDNSGWPTSADGFGPSIVLCDLMADQNDGASWQASTSGTGIIIDGNELKGSPGSQDAACSPCPNPDSTFVTQVTCDSTLADTSVTTFVGSDGCDSLHTVYAVFDPGSLTVLSSMAICDGDSLLIFGQYRTLAGIYRDTVSNLNGCDSILEKELIVNPGFSVAMPAMSICAGDSLLIFGSYQSAAGTYFDTLQTQAGCDSVVSKELMVDSVINTNETRTICEGDSILIFGSYETLAGAYSNTSQSGAGCDSIHTVNLMVLPAASGSAVEMICEGDSLFVGGAYQTASGNYFDTLMANNGCDSILTTTLLIKPLSSTTVSDSICPGDSVFAGGAYQTMAGNYTDVFIAGNGCDSTVTTLVTIRDSANCPTDTGSSPLVCVSDSSWRLSTVVTTATANSYPWPGVMAPPPLATFTEPVDVGQPYPWEHLFTVPGSDVITAESGVTYYLKTFELVDPTGIEARFRMFVDDDMQIFINGQWIALEDDLGPDNWRTANHDLLFNGNGTYTNGNMGGDMFDAVTPADLDTVFRVGINSVVLAIRNRTSKPDIGGFSFRMDLDKGAVAKSAIAQSRFAHRSELQVYPNPTRDRIVVVLNNPSKEAARVMVYDFSGKLLQSKPMNGKLELNLSAYSQGVYLVKVIAGGETYSQKVIKE